MEDFLDGEKPTGSEAKSNEKEIENPYKLSLNQKEGEYIPSDSLRFQSQINNSERQELGSYYRSQNPNKLLADSQRWYEQLGNMAGHIVTNFVGDTIASIGSASQIAKDVVDEVRNKDAEFNNGLIEFGNSIKDWGKKNLKTYRENPNESWNVSDPAWWFDGIESAASSLSFLVGGIGAVKGMGAVAKLVGAEAKLAKAGINVGKAKFATKIATSASFARNAENMMESLQVQQETKNNLLTEWESNPSKFEDLKNSEVGKELANEGREVTQENLSKFIAGKAAWKAYAINGINIVFDAMQMVPLFKGFNAETAIGKMATKSSVLEANRKVLNPNAIAASRGAKVMDALNPLVSSIGRQASEGVEEMVNYIGSEEGKNLADQLTSKDSSSFGERITKYLKSGDFYESGFWGLMGGTVFEGTSHLLNKALVKGSKGNDSADLRIAEINGRLDILKTASDNIEKVTKSPDLDDATKKIYVNNIKSSLALDLGLRAAQHGNVDLLTDMIKSPEYKSKLVDLGIADPLDVEKAVAKTIDDVKLAEKLYKIHYNNFAISDTTNAIKNSLISESVVTDFFIQKNEQRKADLSNELKELKAIDPYVKNYQGTNLESLIELEALRKARRDVKTYINQATRAEDKLLSTKGEEKLNSIRDRIEQIKKQVKGEKLNLEDINPLIIDKQAEIELINAKNSIQANKNVENRKHENIKKKEAAIKTFQKEAKEHNRDAFKEAIKAAVEGDGITIDQLEQLKEKHKDNKDRVDYLNDVITNIKKKQETETTKADVKEALDSTKANESEDPFKDLPQFDVIPIDNNQVHPAYKSHIDEAFNNRNTFELQGVTGDDLYLTNPNEVQYARNKVQGLRNDIATKKELIQINSDVVSNTSTEPEFVEEVQPEFNTRKRVTVFNLEAKQEDGELVEEKNDDSDPNELDFNFLSKDITSEGVIRCYIPMFGINTKKAERQWFIRKGDIVLKDDAVDLVKLLMSSEFKAGAEVEIHWDPKNPKLSPTNLNNKNETAYKLVHKGITIGYLPTIFKLKKSIELQHKLYEKTKDNRYLRKAQDLEVELPRVIDLRSRLTMDEKVTKVKMTNKGNGTVISRGEKESDLRSLEGTGFTEFYALDPRDPENKTRLINISDPSKTFSSVSDLTPGIIYARQNTANDVPFPYPLSVSKVTLEQSKELQKSITSLLLLLNQGFNRGNEDVKSTIKDIEKYIKVDRTENYDKPIGFRIYPKAVNEEGQETDARIEMRYFSKKRNAMLTAVMKISTKGQGSWVGIKDENGERINPFNTSDADLTLEHPVFLSILQRKYQNVDFRLLHENAPFDKYDSYKDYLIKEQVLKTDLAQVVDEKGKVISNLFGQDNDFNLIIDTTTIGEDVTKQVVEEFTHATKEFEEELTLDKAKDTNQEWREKYSAFDKSVSDPSTLINEILNNPKTANIKEVATFLKSHISKASFTIQRKKNPKDRSAAIYSVGISNPKGSIFVEETTMLSELYFQQTMLHEMLHGMTVNLMYNTLQLTPANLAEFKKLDTIKADELLFRNNAPKYAINFMKDIVAERNSTIDKLTKKYGKTLEQLTNNPRVFYGLENPMEFISEVMVNPNFRNELRKIDDDNFLISLYNKIVDFLNESLGLKIDKIKDIKLKRAVNIIKNIIEVQPVISPLNVKTEEAVTRFNAISYSRIIDQFDNEFNDQEIHETINTFEGIILNGLKDKKLDITSQFQDIQDDTNLNSIIRERLQSYYENECAEILKPKMKLVLNHFSDFYLRAINKINRDFRIGTSFDIEGIEDSQEVVKEWNDKASQQVSSQDNVTNKIKMFIKTVPELNSLNLTLDSEFNPKFDRKSSTTTGLGTYVDFNTIYPYLVRNLVGARTSADILNRLGTMATVNPSFAYIAYYLKQDKNLLAQFQSNLAKKYVYDSYVTFIKNFEGNKEIWTNNEMKSTRYDYLISDEWVFNVNQIIDSFPDSNAKVEFQGEVNSLILKIKEASTDLKANEKEIVDLVFKYANKLGINLSIGTIEGKLSTITDFHNFEIFTILNNIYDSIKRGKKSNDFGRLNTLAKMESLIRFDIVENSGLDIKGNLIYAIRNPNFISNWFQDTKSETEEGRKAFEEKLFNIAKSPEAQFYNWLWNDKNYKGLLNYKEDDKRNRVPTSVNWDFMKSFSFHNFGGAKELVSNEAQDYTDYSDKDWMLINLINYIRPDEKSLNENEKEFVFIPSLIPSDSGNMNIFEIPKVKLGSNEIRKVRNSKGIVTELKFNNILGSKIFNSILRSNWQEVKRIQQSTKLLFDIVDDKYVPKKDLKITDLQQNYHYGREIVYDTDGKVDWNSTLLDENGKPKGKSLYFNNMLIKSGDSIKTLNDTLTAKDLVVGETSTRVINEIKNFTEQFINNQINEGYKAYKDLNTEVQGKYKNISDGSYENLISEYILNHYIANVEQYNLFNGALAEYKDKLDPNKRAKQMFAPGIALALEFMKIEYENGNFSDGYTFKGVTIKDINVTSKAFEQLFNTVKESIINERPEVFKGVKATMSSMLGEKPNKLEKEILDIIQPYRKINAGDAQGYITLDRYEQIMRGLGRFDDNLTSIVNKARRGETLNTLEIKTIQPLKGFYYGRDYDVQNNRLVSNQIKYSTMPLIPQLVVGTELEKLMKWMNKTNTEEAFFESAHKIGAKAIYKIDNEDGSINEDVLKNIEPTIYYNKNWQLQLDVPDHLLDEENLLATQIAKLIIANLNPNTNYKIGDKEYNSKDLINHYFNLLENNITESANQLIKELGIVKTDTGFIIRERNFQRILMDEIKKRGLSDNYAYAIEMNGEEFRLPLIANNMATKWEAILTSIFTNRIMKQKMPGGSTVLGSRLFLDKSSEQSKSDITGIEWSDEKKDDKTLKVYNKDGVKVIEVLLSSWSSQLFEKGERIKINEIPEEIRTMIGYRIPTQAKHSMVVMKVVGFLPEQNRGLIITPDDIVAQMGSDFDIDKLFTITRTFIKTREDGFIIPGRHTEEDKKKLQNDLANLLAEARSIPKDEAVKLLADSIWGSEGLISSEEAENELYQEIREKKTLLNDRIIRNNQIFDIYESILKNKSHAKEIITPAEFNDFKKLKQTIDKITKTDDSHINPNTELGQRTFRKRNISGRALKGISANLNAFGAIAQVSKMKLGNHFIFKINLNEMSEKQINELKDRYRDDISIDNKSATIKFSRLGYAPNDSYLNLDGKLILEHASQGIGAAVDIVKDPTFDSFNATTYTYPLFHTMLLAGIPTRIAGMFIRQPILKRLNDYYFDTKSILGDTSGNEVESVKRFFQTLLYKELVDNGDIKGDSKHEKVLDRRKANNAVSSLDKKYLIFVDRKDTQELLGYDPDNLEVLTPEKMEEQIHLSVEGWSKLKHDQRVNFLRTQLQVIEYFNKWRESSEGVQDILRATKTDAIGAGPSMEVTNKLIRDINRLEKNERVLINGIPAIKAIYPSHFKMNGIISAYRPLDNYLEYVNKLSSSVLSNLFITQSPSYADIVFTARGIAKNNSDTLINTVNKFLNINILQDFELFRDLDKKQILGIETPVITGNTDFDTFTKLSVANKIAIMQSKQADYLTQTPQHILNFLTPILDNTKIAENKYHKIDFVFYKNETTDDSLANSITEMYYTGDEFEKDLAESLIKYAFVAYGLGFNLRSFSKVIPSKLLADLGLGEYLRDKHGEAKNTPIFDFETVDKYFRNNWNNSEIVPKVSTRWEYLQNDIVVQVKDMLSRNINKAKISIELNISISNVTDIEKGYSPIIKKDSEGDKVTKDNSPHWNVKENILVINEKSLKTLNKEKINASYLFVPTKEGGVLYKKYITQDLNDDNEVIYNTTFDGNVYYYKVSKLGKDGINEFTDKSMFHENNVDKSESVLIARVEDTIAKLNENKIKNGPKVNNTPKDDQDNINKECGYGN